MIGHLEGVLESKRPPWLTVDVGGVGYELEAPMSTFYALPSVGERVRLVTHLLVREDAQLLYGFKTDDERELFRRLIRVSGIGARIALGVLSSSTVDGFYDCVRHKDLASLTKVPGVGRKTAERLLVEMGDRLPEQTLPRVNGTEPAGAESEAQHALVALGYRPAEVLRMLKALDVTAMRTEDIIREALRRAHG
ncbi:MAG: Holliday junction branch migration protein RuvA [Gammaproteobacteria bacterium]|jgi:Holliday junction DNA helicase RuvA